MDPWIYVERVNIVVEGIDPEASDLLQIRIDLNRVPEDEWQSLFEENLTAGTGSTSIQNTPRLVADAIMIRSLDDDIETHVRHLDQQITTTNEQYASRVLPHLRVEEAKRESQADEQQRRLRDAQKRLDGL